MWAATGDIRFMERANYIVEQVKEIQDAQLDGCIGWSEPDAVVDGIAPNADRNGSQRQQRLGGPPS
jgi:hypothetical protein